MGPVQPRGLCKREGRGSKAKRAVTLEPEVGAGVWRRRRGPEPRNAGGLQNLGNAGALSLLRVLQREHSPGMP